MESYDSGDPTLAKCSSMRQSAGQIGANDAHTVMEPPPSCASYITALNHSMLSRKKLVDHVAALVGHQLVQVIDSRDGWPGLAEVQLSRGIKKVALHVGPIGLSHRKRDDVERRFQNPGTEKPVLAPEGFEPVLLGLWEGGNRPVLVVMDAQHRLGKTTRQSLFIPLWQLEEAARIGWAEHQSTTGERVVAFHPALLPSYLESMEADEHIPAGQIAAVVNASGLNDPIPEVSEARARRAASQLVRSAVFSRNVLAAYNGLCAMCGLNFGLVQGAHIYPAHAPDSQDVTTNGIALCGNHHGAFDKYLLWVDPDTRAILVHPEVIARRALSPACAQFIDSTFPVLHEPRTPADRPTSGTFRQRYDLYPNKYEWAV